MGELVKMPQEELQLNEHKELIKKEYDQLHHAVLQFSNSCLEIKKMCSTVLAAIAGIILVITGNKLDTTLFGATFMIIIVFWIVDSQAYYYQKKLRRRMNDIANELRQTDVTQECQTNNVLKAMANWSQIYYLLIAFLILIAFIIY